MHQVQKSILEILKKSKEEFTINEISELIKVDRHTAGKYLEALEAMGMCQFRTQGKSKLWSLSASPLFNLISKENPVSSELKALLERVEENVTFQDGNHSIIWSNKPQQTGKKCYEVFAGEKDVCKDCSSAHEITKNAELKGTCKNHSHIGTPIKDAQNNTIASINIRKSRKDTRKTPFFQHTTKGESHE